MRKVALAITGLLLALGGGAHGKTVPAQGPTPWCEGHADVPTGNIVTASAGIERGAKATGVFVCFEVVAGGSRPTSAAMNRVWFDPDDGVGAVECVPHRDARLAPSCYRQVEAPADDERRKADHERRNGADELDRRRPDTSDSAPADGIGVDTRTPTPCPSVPGADPTVCVDSHRVAAQADPGAEPTAHAVLDERETCIGDCGGGR